MWVAEYRGGGSGPTLFFAPQVFWFLCGIHECLGFSVDPKMT